MIGAVPNATLSSWMAAPWAAVGVLWFAAMTFAGAAHAQMREDRLVLVTSTGRHEIRIEVAETPQQKALGLMFRTSMAENRGMLFPYGAPQEITMWMRNTYIPLDMVFIRADGTVHRVEARAEPLNEKIIPSRGPVVAVLELAGGVAEKLGLKAGDKVLHATFGTAP
jgi:uncharacterized membrane protein (UPF0127 family)